MKIAMVTECGECGTILEAPLMKGSSSCCRQAVKELCVEFMKKSFMHRLGREAGVEEMVPFIMVIDAVIGTEYDGPQEK